MFRTIEKPTKSNRKPKFLESRATPTKQTSPHRSNRKKNALFAIDFSAPAAPQPPSHEPQFAHPNSQKFPQTETKSEPATPRFCFGFNSTRPIVFLHLQRILSEPMFRLEKRNHPQNRLRKHALRRQKADHQIPIAREVKEMPRMQINIPRRNQLNRQLLIRARRRHPQNRIPPTLTFQPRARRLRRQPLIEHREIGPHPLHQSPLEF